MREGRDGMGGGCCGGGVGGGGGVVRPCLIGWVRGKGGGVVDRWIVRLGVADGGWHLPMQTVELLGSVSRYGYRETG